MVKFSDFSDLDREKENLGGKEPVEKPVEEPEAIYNEAFGFVKQMHDKIPREKELDLQDVRRFTEKLANSAALTEDKIIFLTNNIYAEDYLLYHTVNVSILAVKIGMHLKYPYELIVDLGVIALLHGMEGSEDEGDSAQMLEKHKFIRQFIRARGLEERFIKEAISIIALLDVYESLTHSRAYRSKFMPYEVLKAIISAAEEVFNPKIVKEIINVFTIYPLGSTVRLNTEEVAQVIRINREFPLRPEVLILRDSQGKEIKEKKTIDLLSHHNIYIKEII